MAKQAKPMVDEAEAQAFQRLVLAAMKIVYDKTVAPRLIQMVQGAETPVGGLVQATMIVIEQLGQKIQGRPQQSAYVVTPIVLSMVYELCMQAGVLEKNPELAKQALLALVEQVRARAPQQARQVAGQVPWQVAPEQQGTAGAQMMEV